MPTLTELRSRLPRQRDSHADLTNGEESLIADARGRLTPAEMVELKLRGLLAKPKTTVGASYSFRGKFPK
jgi:hypothetical protein